jgi:serine-protein kinase ATM
MCKEHPFHSIYQLYALLSPNSKNPPENRSSRPSQGQSNSQFQREDAVLNIFDVLAADINPNISSRLKSIAALCDACVEWAGKLIKGDSRFNGKSLVQLQAKSWSIGDSKISQIKDIGVPVMTIHTPLDPTMRYDRCITIQSFAKTFRIAGGNARPKIQECVGSDGKLYTQLVRGYSHSWSFWYSPLILRDQFKGADDLRQDAVMEQVFQLVNTMLDHDRETKRRKLRVRDYKVIPLDPAGSGVIEFVENTTTFKDCISEIQR